MSELTDLLERYRRGPEVIAVATTGASNVELDFVPAPGKWSVRQICCHLADSEIVGADRFRRTIAEDNPTLVGYDGEAWAENLGYSRRRISQVMQTFRHLRGETHDLLQSLPESAFSRVATHTERGQVTLLGLLRYDAEHTESHARQISAVRQSYNEARKAQS
jgi:hypothetical protein